MSLNVHNLASDEVTTFDEHTAPIYGVCQCYAWENGLAETFNMHAMDGTLEAYYKELPVVIGGRSIACGNWRALTEEGES